jgi:hypothetical protein
MEQMRETPAAANKLLTLVRRLIVFAGRRELLAADVTPGIAPFKMNPNGFATWTEAAIDGSAPPALQGPSSAWRLS